MVSCPGLISCYCCGLSWRVVPLESPVLTCAGTVLKRKALTHYSEASDYVCSSVEPKVTGLHFIVERRVRAMNVGCRGVFQAACWDLYSHTLGGHLNNLFFVFNVQSPLCFPTVVSPNKTACEAGCHKLQCPLCWVLSGSKHSPSIGPLEVMMAGCFSRKEMELVIARVFQCVVHWCVCCQKN